MANERISMTKIKQILRMLEEGYSKRQTAKLLNVHRDTVTKYIALLKDKELSYIDVRHKTDNEIDNLLDADRAPCADRYEHLQSLMPWIEKELKNPVMTRTKLWEEYKEDNPGGYNLSQFNEHIRRYMMKNQAVMHFEHKDGDKMYIDYAGKRLYLTDRESG